MRRFFCGVFFVAFLIVLIGTVPASAQNGRGVIAGTVKDAGNNVLIGAVIQVSPSGQRAVSDDQGNFRIPEVPSGQASLTVSYVGLANFTSTVNVAAGQTDIVSAVLQVPSLNEQIVVQAERLEGQAEAVNIERSSDDIVQVLPLKVITGLPNTNIADAVGRLPSVSLERDEGEGKYVQIRGTEPRLNNVTINGVNTPSVEGTVRNIKLDSVSSNLVERIEVFKTLTSNQDSDGVGGTVNLVTKTAADTPTIEFGGEGGYTPIQGGRTLGEFDGTFGKRFGPSHKFGFLLGGTWDRNNRGIDDAEVGNQATGTIPGTSQSIGYAQSRDYRTYEYYRTRYGFDTGIDYNISPETSVYVKGLYSDFHDYGDVWVYTPNTGNTIKAVNGSVITFDNALDCQAVNEVADATTANSNPCSPGSMQYRHYIRRPDQQLYSILTGARKDSPNWLLIWEAAGSRGHNIGGQDFQTTNFQGPLASYDSTGKLVPGSAGVDIQVDHTDPLNPILLPTPTDHTNIYDPTLYGVSNSSFNNYIATDVAFQGSFSAARRYSVHSHYGTFEMGFKIRDSHTTQKETDLNYSPPGASPFTLAQVLGTYTNSTYYDKAFLFNGQAYGPTSDYIKILQQVDANIGGSSPALTEDPIADGIKSASAFFDADERIYAAYLMNGISVGKWRFNTGVRFEDTQTGFLANKVDKSKPTLSQIITPFTQTTSYFNALPSIQVQYLIEKNTNIRGNFSMGISRPNIQDEVPSQTFDPNGSPPSITLGNPNLKATRANNYDVLVEHFFQPLGILQGGFFYKQLYNPIYSTGLFVPVAGFTNPFLQTLSINGPSAHITGFEMDWEQRFSFLPSLASGLGIAANYSHTASQATFPAGFACNANDATQCRTDKPPLQRTAPNTYNIGITYDKARFSMRFGISHNDASIFNYQFVQNSTPNDPVLGLPGPFGDNYLYAHTQYDVQGSYRMYKGLTFIVSGLNLTNEVFGFYNGSPQYPNQREFYKPTVSFGMRWSSAAEK
jgi:TonB-dependent receptor